MSENSFRLREEVPLSQLYFSAAPRENIFLPRVAADHPKTKVSGYALTQLSAFRFPLSDFITLLSWGKAASTKGMIDWVVSHLISS